VQPQPSDALAPGDAHQLADYVRCRPRPRASGST
jgi:hypothetical protein